MSSARNDYLATEVLTASPQRLQLMLIDAAIRHATRAVDQWRHGQFEAGGESVLRSQEVVSQLICGIDSAQRTELTKRVGGVYLFVFRALVAAHSGHSEAKLKEALSILEIERDTWREVCAQLGTKGPAASEYRGSTSFVA